MKLKKVSRIFNFWQKMDDIFVLCHLAVVFLTPVNELLEENHDILNKEPMLFKWTCYPPCFTNKCWIKDTTRHITTFSQ